MKFNRPPGGFQQRHLATPQRNIEKVKAARAHTRADAFKLSTHSDGRYRSGENVRMMEVKDFIV